MLTLAAFIALAAHQVLTPSGEIRATIQDYVAATVRLDATHLNSLFSHDYVEVSPLGEVDPREKVIGFYSVPKESYGPLPSSFSVEELSVRFSGGDIAIAIYREDFELEAAGKKKSISFRVTSVLHKEKGAWRLLSNHVTGIQPSKHA